MFTIGESRAISHANDTEQQAKQVAGNPRLSRIFHRNSSGERRLKFIASGSKKTTALQTEHRLAQRRQWCQHSDHKHVQRHRQNTQCDYTASETDEEREHRRPTLQKATRQAIRQRLKFIVKIILSIISKLFVVKYSLL